MKKIYGILLIGLLAQCTSWKQCSVLVETGKEFQPTFERDITEFIRVPPYTEKMRSGDVFLRLISPGYALGEEDLSFTRALAKTLASPDELVKAYTFSALVDGLLLTEGEVRADGSLLSDYYSGLLNGSSPSKPARNRDELPAPMPSNFPLTKISCAACNDDFFLTIVNPLQFPQSAAWTALEKSTTTLDSVIVKGKPVRVILPLHQLSMEICSLKVERPWFKLSYARSAAEKNKRAYVEEIIFARKVALKDFSRSRVEMAISARGNKQKTIRATPTTQIDIAGSVIIGYVYRII